MAAWAAEQDQTGKPSPLKKKKLIVPSQAVMNIMRPVHVGSMVDKVGLGQGFL
jgi:hypothetical protein